LSIAALGVLGGIASASLIAVVNKTLHHAISGWVLPVAFVLVAGTRILCSLASSLLLTRLSQNAILELCDELCARILNAPFREIEKTGAARLLTHLTDDISTLAAAIQSIPSLTVNLAILAGCTAYLAWLSWISAVSLVAFVTVGAITYRFMMGRAHKAIRRAREGRDVMFRNFRAMTEGIKELKLSRGRRESFLRQEIGETMLDLKKHNLTATRDYVLADGWSQIMFYGMMGALLFILPGQFALPEETLTAYVFAALYASAPIWGIIGSAPVFDRGREALERLQRIELPTPADPTTEGEAPHRTHPTVEFRDVRFVYESGKNTDPFTLGPLNLTLEPGELVFVIGGNGSGKSTFVKLLTGLYSPVSGEILLDGYAVTPKVRQSYCELFSVVYSDFYLFDRIQGGDSSSLRVRAQEYIELLELGHKVKIEGDRLSTTELSQGQRRRLALLAAYLEDRPIFVLDEWAADQDPAYRQIFYTKLLPELKRKGKTVVVVTHDDRYFHMGDRLLELYYGSLTEIASRRDSTLEGAMAPATTPTSRPPA
jgi:putative ATP-binding cassette transporter